MPVTTSQQDWIIIFLVGDPYKSSFRDCWLGVDPSNGIDQLIHVSIFGGCRTSGSCRDTFYNGNGLVLKSMP